MTSLFNCCFQDEHSHGHEHHHVHSHDHVHDHSGPLQSHDHDDTAEITGRMIIVVPTTDADSAEQVLRLCGVK